MARTVSLNMRQAMFSQETSQVPILLLTISHADITDGPFRFSSDPTVRITDAPLYGTLSRGLPFYFLPFSAILPDDKDEAPPQARLVLDNIDREIIALLRRTSTPAQVRMELVLSSTPNNVEVEFPELDLVGAEYDAASVTLSLQIESLMSEPYPAGKFDLTFPSLHGDYPL